ncbi:MAG: hypothetical protein ABI054_06095 [Planctomycetota bacterium]
MKTLDDVKADMSRLYDEVNAGSAELKTAAELANIAGKYLKAEQLQLAREIFLSHIGKTRRIAGDESAAASALLSA